MKKLFALLLACMMLMPLVFANAQGEKTEITLWTYPIGNWGKQETLDEFIKAFNEKYPNVSVKVQLLSYGDGDAQVTTALEAKTAPDIIMEGPERLVSNWGVKGKMVDLADLWTEEALKDISATSEAVVKACKSPDGVFYEYPLCMTTHTMAINKEAFEKANAMQYLDAENRTWTTDNFVKAMKALKDSGVAVTGAVYCGGQGGDQGTRALAMNLYSAQFTDPEHTKYTMNEEKGVKGLKLLQDMVKDGLLVSDAGIAAKEELQNFAAGVFNMSFCWNAANAMAYANDVKFTPFAMAFPSDDGVPELAGGIWGFGIFNNGDEAKIAAAKDFIRFMCDDKAQVKKSVYATGFFPVRSSVGDVYTGTEKESFKEFQRFMPYLGDYYAVTPNWPEQRTEWWNLLQRIFQNGDVQAEADVYAKNVNK